jgi:hypothetical protein
LKYKTFLQATIKHYSSSCLQSTHPSPFHISINAVALRCVALQQFEEISIFYRTNSEDEGCNEE